MNKSTLPAVASALLLADHLKGNKLRIAGLLYSVNSVAVVGEKQSDGTIIPRIAIIIDPPKNTAPKQSIEPQLAALTSQLLTGGSHNGFRLGAVSQNALTGEFTAFVSREGWPGPYEGRGKSIPAAIMDAIRPAFLLR